MTEPDATLRGRSVLVTGPTGIVGSWLVEELISGGASVVSLVRDEVPDAGFFRRQLGARTVVVRGSVEDHALLERILADYSVEVIFHLAAQTQVQVAQRHPLATLEANVRGTYLLLEAARRAVPAVSAVIVASSDKAYGDSDALPYSEEQPLAGRNIYDVSKSAADLISSAYAHSFGLPIAIARCGNVYGGGDLNWDRIVPGTIRALIAGERPVVRSDGSPRRDYLYVRDAVAAYLRLAEAVLDGRHHGEAFNFGTGRPLGVLELVEQIRQTMDRLDLEPLVLDTASHEIKDQYLDVTRAARDLSWQARYDLRTGLPETIEWYREVLTP